LQWRCKSGHVWWAVPGSVIAGTWCPKCRDLHSGESQRLSLEHMRATARARGGQCLATEYRNTLTKLRWRCAGGHEWMATPGHVRNGRWCPECKRLRAGASQRLSIKDAQNLAERRSGKCLSLVYKNASTPMEWQCAAGHHWKATYNKVQQKHWCPFCRITS